MYPDDLEEEDNSTWCDEADDGENERPTTPDYLFLYVGAFIFVSGLLGNTLIFFVFSNTKSATSRTLKTRLHIEMLAVCDILTLLFGLMRRWLQLAASVDFAALRQVWCKTVAFTTYYATHLSAWIIVCMTMERFAAVYFPLTANAKSHQSINLYILGGLSTALFLLDFHVLFPATIKQETRNATGMVDTVCVLMGAPWYHKLWSSIDFVLYTGLPCLIILTLNVLIICRIRASHSETASDTAFSSDDRSTAPLSRTRGSKKASLFFTYGKKIRTQQKITKTLLCVSFCYMLFTIPHVLCVQIQNFIESCDLDFLWSHAYDIIHAVTELFMYSHHAVQFYIYFFSGERFRSATLRIIWRHGMHTRRRNAQNQYEIPMRRAGAPLQPPQLNKAVGGSWGGLSSPNTFGQLRVDSHAVGDGKMLEKDHERSSSPSIRLRTAMSISVVETCAKTYKLNIPVPNDSHCVLKCDTTVLTQCNS